MKKAFFVLCCSLILVGCAGNQKQSFINQYADVLLTKNNELQFRFKFNERLFSEEDMYKVKVLIENKELAKALGTAEIYYGEQYVHDGKLLHVGNQEEIYLSMDPIPLQIDLHTFVLEEMIQQENAVKVQIFNEDDMIISGYVQNFQSQL
ncbi:hypothetical protein M3175_22695 [Robertmurraya korlensis]|uniref:hypothetical protein n=1 Tax=Robertmurraya korlensis TaxID=519977 RepID=UPI00203B1B59|nr:hypothetical protein [Robertmurraya korlensis]MCM3603506.1 hypothetical protein [Robertmurraya korlensis]